MEGENCLRAENYQILKSIILNKGGRIRLEDSTENALAINLGVRRKIKDGEYKLLSMEKVDLAGEDPSEIYIQVSGKPMSYRVFLRENQVRVKPDIQVMLLQDMLLKFDAHFCEVVKRAKQYLSS